MTARGFKGRYFSLAAITATAAAVKLEYTRIAVRPRLRALFARPIEEETAGDPPSLETLLASGNCPCAQKSRWTLLQSPSGVHCSCVFRRKSRFALFCTKLLGAFHCECRHHNTGLSPPVFS